MSYCRVIIMGRLGRDPELKYAQSGTAICSFTVAVDDGWGDKKTTEWNRCVAFQKSAEFVANNFKKGSAIHLEGRLKTREWEKDGVKRQTTEIVVDRATFVPRNNDNQAPAHGGMGTGGAAGPGNSDRGGDSYGYYDNAINGPGGGGGNDDIPFLRRDY